MTHAIKSLTGAAAAAALALTATPAMAIDPSARDVYEGNLLYNGQGKNLNDLRENIRAFNDAAYIYTAMEAKQPAENLYLCKRVDKTLTLTFGKKAQSEINIPVMTMEIFEDQINAVGKGLIDLANCTPLIDDKFARQLREEIAKFNDASFRTGARDLADQWRKMPKANRSPVKVTYAFI